MMRQIQSQGSHEANTEDTTRVPKLKVGAPHEGHKTNPRSHEMIKRLENIHLSLPSDLSFMTNCIKCLLIKSVQNL